MAQLNIGHGTIPLGSVMVEWAAAGSPAAGERRSGDAFVVRELDHGVLFAVIDAIGHGDEAAQIATTAIGAFEAAQGDSPLSGLLKCHGALGGTRGAVAAAGAVDGVGSMTWLAVGNVSAVVVRQRYGRPEIAATAPLNAGILGLRIPTLKEKLVVLRPGDLVVISTDGIETTFSAPIPAAADLAGVAAALAEQHRNRKDDGLLLLARYLGSRDHE